jgi:hypothetical protein
MCVRSSASGLPEISRQYLRWLHPTSRRRSDETFL